VYIVLPRTTLCNYFSSFLVSATSASILSSSPSFLAAFLAVDFGASCKAFKDKPILFLVGSKLIILAVTSSPTLT
jgi:hypothetical protein